jgi:ABC-type nitrate/sulfonate/bicarbonate transport system permease component
MTEKALAERRVATTDGVRVRTFSPAEGLTLGPVAEKVLSLLSPLLILVLWEVLVRVGLLDARFFPAPSQIAGTFWRLLTNGQLPSHTGISLTRAAIGFLIGAVPGVMVGLALGLIPLLRSAIWPSIGALYPIPKIAILPLVMLVFGLGEESKWAIIAIGVFFPMVINTMAGVMSIDQIYHDVGRNFGASRLDQYLTIALPGALPLILTGVRLGWGTALLLMVTAEFVSKSGLGFLIWQSWQSLSVESMYVGIITVSLLGYLSFVVLDELARFIVPWKPEAVQ